MSHIQLQTNPICPKCKKGHPMKVVSVDSANRVVYYETDCRVRPLAFSMDEVISTHPEEESFYFNQEGWITYISTHGNYAYQLTMDAKENAYALAQAYAGENGIIHTPVVVEEEFELDEEMSL